MGAPRKDAEGGVASEDVGAVGHGVDLGAEGMPWVAALHGVVREVGDCVDRFMADDGGGLMEEGVEEDALEGFNRWGAKMVV